MVRVNGFVCCVCVVFWRVCVCSVFFLILLKMGNNDRTINPKSLYSKQKSGQSNFYKHTGFYLGLTVVTTMAAQVF